MADVDDFVDVVGGADIAISPTIAFFKRLIHGNGVQYTVPAESGWSVNEVAGMLRDKGITVYGRDLAGDFIQFRVKETQANFAEHWLKQYGLKYTRR